MLCPLTRAVMRDPVLCADGVTYERAAIAAWLTKHGTSPQTGLPLAEHHLVPNHSLRSVLCDLRARGAP